VSLISAYQQTTYSLLDFDLPFSVRIGVPSVDADKFMACHKLGQLFFVTAENPSSKAWPDSQNLRFTGALMKSIIKRKFMCWPARAEPDENWPREHGFFISCSTQDAILLARLYEQNAIVIVPIGQPAALVLCQKI
jgi:hypothetical protein